MRRSFVALALLAAPTVLPAQGRPRDPGDLFQNAMMVAQPAIPTGVAALVLERADEFALADSQRSALLAVRRVQDSLRAPLARKLDSLRPSGLPVNGLRDLSPEQRDAFTARGAAVAEVVAGYRVVDSAAHVRALEVLGEEQRKRAEKLEREERKKADEETKKRGRAAFLGASGDGRSRRPY